MFDHSAVACPQTIQAPRSQRVDSLNTQKGDNGQAFTSSATGVNKMWDLHNGMIYKNRHTSQT